MENKKNTKILFLLSVLVSAAIFITFIISAISSDNYNYGIEQLSTFDKSLFVNNPSFSSEGFSARFFMNIFYLIPMRLFNLSWETLTVAFVFIGILMYSVGVVNTVFRMFNRYRMFLSIVFSFFIAWGITSGLAGFATFGAATIGIGTAFGVSIISISFVLGKNKKWTVAWIFASVAILFHVHEGIYCFCTLFLLWIIESIIRKKFNLKQLRGFIVFIVVAGICVVPTLLTDTNTLSNAEFVNIYANIRTPHHLNPANYGKENILKYFLLLVYPVAFYMQFLVCFNKKEKIKPFIIKAGLCLLCWILALMAAYFFVNVLPLSTIVTLYLPKFFRYISLLAMVCYLSIIYEYSERGKIIISSSIILFSITVWNTTLLNGLFIFVIICSFVYACIKSEKSTIQLLIIPIIICFANLVPVISTEGKLILLFSGILILLTEAGFSKTLNPVVYKIIIITMTFFIIIASLYGKFYRIEEGRLKIITTHDYLVTSSTQPVYDIANYFRESTEKDVTFLSDPDVDYTGWFQFISQRNCYVIWKNTPSYAGGLEEWYNRYRQVKEAFGKDKVYLYDFMKERSIYYILVPVEKYQEYENSNLFECFLKEGTDTFRIYKITDK